MFQLVDLGEGDATGLGLRAKKKEVGVALRVGVEKVGGQTPTQSLQFAGRSAGQEMSMSKAAFLGRPGEDFLNAGGRERHGGVPPGCG